MTEITLIIDEIIDDVLNHKPGVLVQHMDNLCGFYALYNATHNLQSIAAFWSFYFQVVKDLNAIFNDECRNFKEMQRYHMDYILKANNFDIPVFSYGFNIIQSSAQEIELLQKHFDSGKDFNIICGITIHWINIRIQSGNVIVQDSISTWDPSDKDHANYLRDLANVKIMMEQFIKGKQIIQQQVDNTLFDLRQSYEMFPDLDYWLNEEYHPQVIKSMLVGLLDNHNLKLPESGYWLLNIKHPMMAILQEELKRYI